ncbi:hypothetical protein ACEPAH_2342 [Sanghuangporus vaninii]
MSLDPTSSDGLRQRTTNSRNATGSDDMKGTRNTSTNSENDDKKLKHPLQSGSFPGSGFANRRAPVILALLCAFGFYLLIQGRSSGLPRTYALCSKEGKIHTVDSKAPRAECIVVHDSRIISVGSIEETRKRFGDVDTTGPVSSSIAPQLKMFKNGLKFYYIKPGHIIVPGLADAHAHLLDEGFMRNLQVDNTSSISEVIEKVKDYIKARPDVLNDRNVWIQGMGWDQTKWPTKEFPRAADLDTDPLLRGRPIVLRRIDAHASWVSKRVLEETVDLPDHVEGGTIVRDESGNPTGVFVDNAMSLIKPPAWTEKQMLEFYYTAVKEALSYGLTSIHDAGSTTQYINFFKKVAEAGKLPLRLYSMRYIDPEEFRGEELERFVSYGRTGRLTLRSVKLVSDGALGSWGAAMIDPYTDKRDERGTLLTSPEVLSKLVSKFWDDGFQVNVHCIGDKANNVVLDILEEKLRNVSAEEHRPRIEHAQIMTPSDLERTARLGVIASVQPTHATSDMWYAETRLGPERIKSAYAYKTLLERSPQHVLPLGSDFPVEGVNPLLGFYAAVTRLSESGDSPHGTEGWFPNQRLTREEALKGMTFDAAYASFNEHELGSLTPGKRADFVVLDTDIMTVVPASRILQAKVMATVVDGRPVYGRFH